MFGYKTTSWYFTTAYVLFHVATKPCRITDFLGFYQGTGSSKKHHWAGHSLCETWPASGTGRMCKWEDQSSHSCHGSASLYRWPSCGEGTDIALTGCKRDLLPCVKCMYLYKSGEKSRAARGPRRTHSDHWYRGHRCQHVLWNPRLQPRSLTGTTLTLSQLYLVFVPLTVVYLISLYSNLR